MKQSYSVSTAWSRLDAAITQNNAAVAELNNAANDVASAKSSKAEIYQQLMQEFVANISSPFGAGTLAKIDQKYADQYTFLHDQNAANNAAIGALVNRYGPVDSIPAKLQDLGDKSFEMKAEYTCLRKEYDNAIENLNPVWIFDKEAGCKGKPLVSQDASYFSSKTGLSGFFARVFDSHYKQGRKLLAAFEKKGITIADTQSKFDQVARDLDKNKTAAEKNSFEQQALKEAPGNIKKLNAKLKSDDQIQALVTNTIINDARDKSVFDALTAQFLSHVPEYLVEVRAKIDAYDKLEASAREKAKQLKEMAKPIESKLPKLKSAAGKPGATLKDIDLDAIEGALKQAQENAKKNAEQVKKGKEKVTTYDRRYDTSTMALDVAVSALDTYTSLLMYDMLFDMMDGKLDGHGGLFNGGLDLGDALSGVGSGFSNVFNTVSFDTFDISETLSKIEMPDVSGLMDGVSDVFGNIADGAGDFFSNIDL